MKKMGFLLKRLSEPSTFAGLAALLGAANVGGLSPAGWEAVTGALSAVAAALAVILPEKGSR